MSKLIFTILFLNLSIFCFGQNYFQKVFGDSTLQEKGHLVHQTDDGTIYFVGSTAQTTNGNSAIAFFKMTANGQIIAEKEVIINGSLFPNAMLYEDGNFLIVGEWLNPNINDVNTFLLVMDTSAQVVQLYNYGTPTKNENLNSIIKTQNGGYVLAGFITAANGVGNDVYLARLTPNFLIEWDVTHSTPVNDVGHKAVELPNGNLLVTCDQLQSNGSYNVYCQIYGGSGRFVRDFVITEPYNGGSKSVILDANNDIVIVGEMSSPTSAAFDMYMVKLDLNGQLIWTKYLTNTVNGDAGFSIIQPNDDTYLVVGYGVGPVSETQDIALISTDTSGQVIERKYYGGTGVDVGYTVFPSINGGYLAAGFDNIGSDLQYFLIYDNINVTVSTNEIQKLDYSLTIFPNPVIQQRFNFNESIEKAKVVVVNMQGQILESGFIENSDHYQLKNQLPSGNYFVNLQFEKFQKTIQISIEH